jgi:hypothetical protein
VRFAAPGWQKTESGEVAEWSNAPDSKSGLGECLTWVRIPPSPPKMHKPLIFTRNQGFFVFDYQNNDQTDFGMLKIEEGQQPGYGIPGFFDR